MNWIKEFDETDNTWVVGRNVGEMFEATFAFNDEDMADLMLFCLERAIA